MARVVPGRVCESVRRSRPAFGRAEGTIRPGVILVIAESALVTGTARPRRAANQIRPARKAWIAAWCLFRLPSLRVALYA